MLTSFFFISIKKLVVFPNFMLYNNIVVNSFGGVIGFDSILEVLIASSGWSLLPL